MRPFQHEGERRKKDAKRQGIRTAELIPVRRSGTLMLAPNLHELEAPLSAAVLPLINIIDLTHADAQADAVPLPAAKTLAHDAADVPDEITRPITRRRRRR